MATIPAICDACGTVWGAENIIGGPGTVKGLRITDSKVGPCPACKVGWGSIPDGVYDMEDEVMSVVEAGDGSTANLQALVDVLQSRRRGETTDAEVMATVQAAAPALAATVESALQKSDPVKWVTVLLTILMAYLNLTTPVPPSAEEIAHEMRTQPVPTYSVPPPKAKKPKATKRPAKSHGKAKQRKSRKRR